jgi:cell fate regulator YaaT (PSP1 superfamily)
VPHLIEVAFKGNRKEFYLWEGDEPPPPSTAVIVEADRGEDLGRVHATGDLAHKRVAGVPHAPTDATPPKAARRLATADEVRRERELRTQDEDARRKAMERVKANQLVMKLSDAEWQWDRKKLTFYFTADKRVDFRQLVRELAAMFRTRIELKQIGVRDEAKRLDGIGRCGRQYCSAAWLPELRPVNLGVAKDQRLSLNPSQISGACGRLMCSLRYEHEFYVLQRKRFPKEGRILRTSKGEEKVIANDIFRERVTVRGVDGEVRVVPLAELRRETEQVAGEMPTPPAGSPVIEADAGAHVDEPELAEHEAERPSSPRVAVAVIGSPDSVERPAAPAASGASTAERVETSESAADAPTPDDGNGERRPARRRGRRGGRRNRGSGGGGSREPEEPTE